MPYQIIRFFKDKPNKKTIVVDTLEEAKEHCSRKDTRGKGWFDGYTEI